MARLPQRRSKFGNRKTEADGYTFDSAKEANRWMELRLLEKARAISGLRRQVVMELRAHEQVIGKMRIDFVYFDVSKGEWIYEDTKGYVTAFWRWKAKHFAAQYRRTILET